MKLTAKLVQAAINEDPRGVRGSAVKDICRFGGVEGCPLSMCHESCLN